MHKVRTRVLILFSLFIECIVAIEEVVVFFPMSPVLSQVFSQEWTLVLRTNTLEAKLCT